MKNILVIGDMHIPSRAHEIPKKMLERINQERFDLVFCTGDLTHERIVEILSGFGKLHIVRGNMDYLGLPENVRALLNGFKFGLTHGDTIYPRGDIKGLSKLAEKMKVDILISGHTHALSVNEVEVDQGKTVLLLNPGSATGVWSGGTASLIPSFMVLKLENRRVCVRTIELIGEELRERNYLFSK